MALTDLIFLLPALVVFWLLLRRKRTGSDATPETAVLPDNPIVVDGSNVLHWGGAASVPVLVQVLQDLVRRGYDPIVFFDANVGYVIGDSYYDEARLAGMMQFPKQQICVVSKGVVADQSILMFATDNKLRVVTNDRYRDWRLTYPHAARKGTLIGGAWREGAVKWRGTL